MAITIISYTCPIHYDRGRRQPLYKVDTSSSTSIIKKTIRKHFNQKTNKFKTLKNQLQKHFKQHPYHKNQSN